MFRCDALTNAIMIKDRLDVTVGNDTSVRRQMNFGVKSSIFDTTGSTADIVDYIGCNVDPPLYGRYMAELLAIEE